MPYQRVCLSISVSACLFGSSRSTNMHGALVTMVTLQIFVFVVPGALNFSNLPAATNELEFHTKFLPATRASKSSQVNFVGARNISPAPPFDGLRFEPGGKNSGRSPAVARFHCWSGGQQGDSLKQRARGLKPRVLSRCGRDAAPRQRRPRTDNATSPSQRRRGVARVVIGSGTRRHRPGLAATGSRKQAGGSARPPA